MTEVEMLALIATEIAIFAVIAGIRMEKLLEENKKTKVLIYELLHKLDKN